MKNHKFMWLISIMLVLSVFLAACGDKEEAGTTEPVKDKEEDKGTTEEPANEEVAQVLNLIETAEIPSIDSSISEDAVGFNVLNNIMEGLYRLDQDSLPVPAMADGEPEISEDGLTYTFKIRDAQWSDGTPVTAHDFVYAWQRAVDPDTGSPYGPYLMAGMIKNATEIGEGTAEIADLGIKAEDDKTLIVELERPVAYFLSLMSFGTFYPLNEEFVTAQGDKYATNSEAMIYNGPFSLADWDGTGNWKYVKNDKYWDADTVKLEEIIVDVVKETATGVKLYEQGKKDRVLLSAEYAMQFADDPNIINELETSVFYFKLNQERNGKATPLANADIRKAFARAFNKEELADAILANGSIAANFLVADDFTFDADGKDFRDYSGEFSAYNVEEAQEYWKKGLAALGTDKVEIEILGGDTENAKKQQEWFKSEFERNLPGLTIKLKEVPFAVRLELDDTSDYDVQSAGWGPDFQDPISFMELFVTGSPQNKMNYSNPEYDKLIESTKTTIATDPVARFEAFAKAEKILLEDDAGLVPQYQRGRMVLMNPAVKGLATHPFGGDYSYKWTYMEAAEK
ncbi:MULTISPECIES: peptide ABC transporter substrate-binding protein [Sporosarcina]|uniref:peptide ABC transporter substrate-binding protein n=1 Tax=Sporosarcina TaxID=1569 RepID=UPI00078CDFCC|nr:MULTISPECIES: peptide ABC transporter substrate-binding protein [Sporosarcina]AMQ07483.1 peptide ABC transporter substrate-binding protein [Sporosarcina psychrophila]QNK87182.1 peptide ABC transporter substrate-binding protein [Sporosarcina sp. resist]